MLVAPTSSDLILSDDDTLAFEVVITRTMGVPWQFLFPYDPIWLELLVAEAREELRGYYKGRGVVLSDR